jgi:hypothetical protein
MDVTAAETYAIMLATCSCRHVQQFTPMQQERITNLLKLAYAVSNYDDRTAVPQSSKQKHPQGPGRSQLSSRTGGVSARALRYDSTVTTSVDCLGGSVVSSAAYMCWGAGALCGSRASWGALASRCSRVRGSAARSLPGLFCSCSSPFWTMYRAM